jgi:tRNA(Ile)-lysidine synthase
MLIDDEVAAFIERERLLAPGERVVAAVSGGADSLCLLDCLHRLGYRIHVAHLDHGLRRGSWRDAEFVLREAGRRGLPAIVERRAPHEWRQRGLSLEEAARHARYAFLVRAARESGAAAIATGHTADDQAETVLMHFLRGAGVHGLRGMLPLTPLGSWAGVKGGEGIALVRPLLGLRRAQTEAHCRAAGLRPRRDETNAHPAYFRNRLRLLLLPELERYNPQVREVLRRTGEVMRREAELQDEILAAVEPAIFRAEGVGTIAVVRLAFLSQPVALQRSLLGRVAFRLEANLRDFGFEAVELARSRFESRAVGRKTTLPGGIELIDQGEHILLVAAGRKPDYPAFPQLTSEETLSVLPPARILLQDGVLSISGEVEPPRNLGRQTQAGLALSAWLDRGRLEEALIIRPPRPGDRMQPLGMSGHSKLADIFNRLRIPAGARARWPVVTSGGDIVWLAGLRIGHGARLTKGTRKAVQLRIELAGGESA